ncbi:filamin-C-like, partial [Excalfactoria chinensis]|uniref:filamin-C-like n=1 Tax=Excalfactoria chinensis TaxID=46218 RepID=UPI003B3AA468
DVSIGIKCCPALPGAAEADIDFTIIKNDNDTFTVKYTPPCAGLLTIMVLFGTQELPCSPFRITVAPAHDSSKVRAEGPGISRTGVQCGCPTHFTVQTRGAGKAPLDVQFGGAAQSGVSDLQLIDNGDYSHTVKYTAMRQGELSVGVTYGGDPIPKSPFPVTVAPPLQLDKVAVQGLNSKVPVGSPQSFSVLSSGAGGQGALSVSAVGPGRRSVPVSVEAAGPGLHRARFTAAEEGQLRFDVTYDGHPVPGSPFVVDAVTPPDPSK